MIGSTRQVRVFAYGAPTDMRKGYEGLSSMVRRLLERDPLEGDLFLFANRRRTRAKVIFWDGTGMCLYCKRLEKGLFADLWSRGGGKTLEMTTTELALFLEGSELIGRMNVSPSPVREKDLYITIPL